MVWNFPLINRVHLHLCCAKVGAPGEVEVGGGGMGPTWVKT